ncbi:MAG: thermonuclease family protein, partial [Gemmatimonadaceae bacterium]|nr:thermonuclease family protein [Gloeobacterales cyanobacterium ES-bin-141]
MKGSISSGWLVGLLLLCIGSCGDVDQWQVKRITDGDTIVLTRRGTEEKVRLLGIDAPEKAQKPWGERSKAHLEKLVGTSEVRLETDVRERDRYGRLLAHVWVGKALINQEMVASGHALLYTVPPNVKYAERLQQAERRAHL